MQSRSTVDTALERPGRAAWQGSSASSGQEREAVAGKDLWAGDDAWVDGGGRALGDTV